MQEQQFELWGKTLKSYKGTDAEVEIPTGIKEIGYYAFKENGTLQKIVIPASVETIKYEAFRGCKKLQEIVLSDELICIEGGVFRECTALEELNIPDSVTEIGDGAFRDCKKLKSMNLPPMLKEISWEMFRGCEHLQQVEMAEDIRTIQAEAFRGCKCLTKAMLPKGLESIEQRAFVDCNALADIEIPASVKKIGWEAFKGTKWAEAQEDVLVVHGLCIGCKDSVRTAVIPEGVDEIIDRAFYGQKNLEQIAIPTSVTKIGWQALVGCNNLKEVVVSPQNPIYRSQDNCLICGTEMIHGCFNSVIPEDVESLGEYALAGCERLEKLDIPSSVKQIDPRCFDNCINLTEVRITNRDIQLQMDDKAGAAFSGCDRITLLQIPGMNISDARAQLKQAMLRAFLMDPVQYDEDKKKQYIKYLNAQKKRLLIEALKNGEILLFAGVDRYGIKIQPELRDELIEQASELKKTEILAWLLNDKNRTADRTKEAKGKMKQNMQEMESPYMAKFLKAEWKWKTLPDGTMEITDYKGDLKEVIIPPMIGKKPVTSIGEMAFRQKYDLLSVVIPDGVRHIQKDAFDSCIRLKKVVLPQELESIGWDAFAGCDQLKEIKIPDSVQSIDGYAFQACKSLKKLMIPEGVKSFGKNVFQGCDKLQELALPAGLKSISIGDFLGCNKIKQITFPEGIEDPDQVIEKVLKNAQIIWIAAHT